jgi:hypothetical protein
VQAVHVRGRPLMRDVRSGVRSAAQRLAVAEYEAARLGEKGAVLRRQPPRRVCSVKDPCRVQTTFIVIAKSEGLRPLLVHFGTGGTLDQDRQITLNAAFAAHP